MIYICRVLVLCLASSAAWAQTPSTKLIVPFAPGGGVDTVARLLARQITADTGTVVVVENRAGANGTVGGKAVQLAAADGRTLLFSAATHVLAKRVMQNPPYDPSTDFAPVARVAEAPLLMVIAPNQKERKLTEVVSTLQAAPDKWTAALPALGAPAHVGTLLFGKQAGVPLTSATYRGTAPALTDVAGGHANMLIDSIIALLPMAKEGKVRAIATLSAKRSAVAPEIPTAVESGFPELVHTAWYGVWAPKDTPATQVASWNAIINDAMAKLAKSGALAQGGIEAINETPAEFAAYIAADIKKSTDLLNAANFKAQ